MMDIGTDLETFLAIVEGGINSIFHRFHLIQVPVLWNQIDPPVMVVDPAIVSKD